MMPSSGRACECYWSGRATASPWRGTGESGLAMLASHYPDLLLLDIDLPGKDGIRVLKEVRSNHLTKDLPAIMVTSNADREIVVQCIRTGAVDYVVKPVKFDSLFLKIHRALTLSELEKKNEKRKKEGAVEVNRQTGITFIIFSGELSEDTYNSFQKIYTKAFQAMVRADEIVFDLRYQPGFTRDQLDIISHIVPFVTHRTLRILAGRNYTALLSLNIDAEEQLFISEEDLESHLARRVPELPVPI
jgi:CheY-like chemotaxis protein